MLSGEKPVKFIPKIICIIASEHNNNRINERKLKKFNLRLELKFKRKLIARANNINLK